MNDSEVLYLVAKYLDSLGCQDGSTAVKRFLNKEYALNKGIEDAKTGNKTFDNLDLIYSHIESKYLRRICEDYFGFASANKSTCLCSLSSLLALIKSQRVLKPSRDQDFAEFVAMAGHSCSIWNYRSVPKPIGFLSLITQDVYRKIILQQHILAHRSAIYCLKYDRRSDYLISASDDYTIKIWSLQSSNPDLPVPFLRHTLRSHLAEIIEVDVSLDNHLMVSVDADCSLVIWCLLTGQPLVSFRGSRRNRVISGLSILPISQSSKCPNEKDGWLLVSSYGCGLHFIRYTHTLIGQGTRRVGANGFVESCCSIRLHPTTTFSMGESKNNSSNSVSAIVLDVSPGGHHVAVGCTDHSVRMFTFSEGGCPISAGRLSAHEDVVNSVAFSNSGVQLATASADGGSCWLWHLHAGLWTGVELKLRKRPKSRPCILRWSCKGTYLIVCLKSGTVNIFNGGNGERIALLTGHEGAVYAVATSPLCEEVLATGGADGRFYIWRIGMSASVVPSVLFFYRFPAPQPITDLGIVWLQSTELEAPLAPLERTVTAMSDPSQGLPSMEEEEERRRSRAESVLQSQRITACVAMPIANGPGFLVATKAGVISLFAPGQEMEPKNERLSGSEPPPYEEQFLHWEMDNAALLAVPQQSNSIALALGSPASSQSFNTASTLEVNQPQHQDASSSNSNSDDIGTHIFHPPPGVLFQLVHEPSLVPFSRLPPAYLTTLRGYPYSADRQVAQVPGRCAFRPVDAIPTTIVDDDGEEVAVDDIQLAASVPATYCYPAPLPSLALRDHNKTYLWCSHWLSNEADLICPLSTNDVKLEMNKFLIRQDIEKQASREEPRLLVHPFSCLISGDVDNSAVSRTESSVQSAASLAEAQLLAEDLVVVGRDGRLPSDSILDADGVEGGDNSEDDSDWSAHRGTEVGWGSSRTRRNRSSANRSRGRRSHSEAAEQPTFANSHYNDTGLASPQQNDSFDDSAIRRSDRQRQRRRRERQNHLEAVRTLRRARRSERLRRFRRQHGLPQSVTILRRSVTTLREVAEPEAPDDEIVQIPEASAVDAKERLKRQLIRSIDFVASHHLDLPLLESPPNGFSCVSNSARGSIPSLPLDSDPDSISWPGPHFDWLSATKPSASPYVPQLGDRLVYVMRGHKEYLNRAWRQGLVPPIDVLNPAGGCLEAERLPLPFEENPGLNCYVCCYVAEMAVHFMRTTTNAVGNRRTHPNNPSSLRHCRNTTTTPSTGRLTRSLIQSASMTSTDAVADAADSVDSFIRLVSLRLVLERQQPYFISDDCVNRPQTSLPHQIFVRYHDVDGVLDFLVLRSVFDEAIIRTWKAGDVFICPVENVWWRGRVLQDFSIFTPSTSDSRSSITLPVDPWLGVRVRWLENDETGARNEPLLRSVGDKVGVDSVVTLSHCLSPWDMHPWVSRLSISDDPTTTFSSVFMHSGDIKIPVDRLTRLFGSRGSQCVRISALDSTPIGDAVERVKIIIDKLMTLNASAAFNSPVDLAKFPNYIVVNPHLVDLLFIRCRLEGLFYRQSEAICFDLEQIFKNALRYNEPASLIVRQAHLITSIALAAVSDETFNLDKLMDSYTSAVALDAELDPTIEASQISSSSTLPAVHEEREEAGEEVEYEDEVKNVGPVKERAASARGCSAVVLPSTSTTINTKNTATTSAKRLRSSQESVDLPSSARKRTAIGSLEEPRYSLRTSTISPSAEPGSVGVLNWQNVCQQMLRELLRDRRSVFFREPVNVNQYATYRQVIKNPMDLGSVQTRLLQHPRQGNPNAYCSPRQFVEDLDLIVRNSRLFNRDPNTQIYSDTRWLSRWIENVARKRLSLFLEVDPLPANEQSVQNCTINGNDAYRGLRSLRRSTRSSRSRFRTNANAADTTPQQPSNISDGVVERGRNSEVAAVDIRFGSTTRTYRGRKSIYPLRNRGASYSTTSSSSSSGISTSAGRPTLRRSLRNGHTRNSPSRRCRRRRRLFSAQEDEIEEQAMRLRPRRTAAAVVRHYYEVDEEDAEGGQVSSPDNGDSE